MKYVLDASVALKWLEPTDSGIVVRPLDDVIREIQAFFADIAPADIRLSDELLRVPLGEARPEEFSCCAPDLRAVHRS